MDLNVFAGEFIHLLLYFFRGSSALHIPGLDHGATLIYKRNCQPIDTYHRRKSKNRKEAHKLLCP
jgi:hypothetical protein